MNNHKDAIELYKKQHNMEIDNLRFEHNQNFNELKTIYENVNFCLFCKNYKNFGFFKGKKFN